nr:nucleolar protein NET1-like isoform X2 [Tanacetum cinerariifolium]
MCEMACQIIQKKQEEKQIEEEQAANARYWKIPACCDDDDDYNSAITPNEPVLSTEEPDNSLSIPGTMCDVHLVNNPTPLEAKDHFEIVINSNDAYSSSDDDSLYNENIEYVEASPHDYEIVSLEVAEIVIPEDEEIKDDNLRKIMLEHQECFPAIGDIKINSLKVKRSGRFYHLPDSMLVKSVFATVKDDWFLSVDASRLAQGVGIQQVDNYKVGGQLALPCAADNCSVDQGSLSTHLTIVNHVVSSVNQFTTGNSDKDYLKNTEEDRPFDHEINSKKRTLVQTESLVADASGAEKKRKTEEKETSVKASEDLGDENIRTNNENPIENNIQDLNDESAGLNKGEKCSGLDQEATVVSSSFENVGAETHVQKNTEASEIILPDVLMSLEKRIEQEIPSEISQKEKGESWLVQNNSEASETVPADLMVVEENIQQEISLPSEISQKEKDNELVEETVMGNEIPSSSLRTSDCELDDPGKNKTAEKEVLSTSLIKTRLTLLKDAADMSEKDLGSTVQESAGDQTNNHKEDKESSRKQEPEVKLPRRKKKAKKSAARNKDESAKSKDELEKSKDESAKNKDEALMERADNIVSETSSIVPATAHETKNDKVNFSNAEKNEVLEKMSPDDVTMQEVEISKPTDVVEETLKELKDAVGRRKEKKNVGRSATRNDAATATNEENVLPHSGREESQDITLIDALLVDDCRKDDILANNDAEVPRTEKNVSQGNGEGIDRNPENWNEKMDGEKRKKTKKSAKNGEGGMPTEISDPHLNDHLNENAKEQETALLDAARIDVDEVKGREAQVFDAGLVTKAKKNKKSSVTGPADLPSKCQSTEIELEPEKNQSTNMTVSEVVKSKDIFNDEGNVSKRGSRDIDFSDYFTPGKDTTTSVKVKKPKKKTKERFVVNFRNDSAIQPQKLISKSEDKKVPTNVVNDPHIPNTDQFKTPKKESKIDAPRISKSAHANKEHGEPSAEVFLNQKSDKPRVILGLASVKTVQKNAPEVNMSQHAETLLSLSGTIFGGNSEQGTADDNASPRKSSSPGEIASSIDSGSCAVKRKGGGGNSQSKSKNLSMTDHVRSSPRFKRAKVTASQQLGNTESEPVDFVPESPPI